MTRGAPRSGQKKGAASTKARGRTVRARGSSSAGKKGQGNAAAGAMTTDGGAPPATDANSKDKKPEEQATRSEVLCAIAFNFFSSTGIVSANKKVYGDGFGFPTTLTFIHFVSTTLGLLILARLRVFSPKPLDIRKAAKLAVAGMGFVVFSNLSLMYNSVGFYQVMKHMTIVGVIVLEILIWRKYLSRDLVLPVLVMCTGITITGMTDFKQNWTGTMFALLNILSTSFYQIWCKNLQKSLEADPLQLQLYIAPLQALFILPVVPIFDNYRIADPNSIFWVEPTQSMVAKIMLTAALALCVNISIFLVIGKTSAVTYNVVGNGKTAFLLCVDFVFFGRPFEPKNFFGMVLTLMGVIWYTQRKMKPRPENEPAAS